MTTFTNQNKSSTTFSNGSNKSSTTFSVPDKTLIDTFATAGLYYGFGLFTYSGGQLLSSTAPVFTNINKS